MNRQRLETQHETRQTGWEIDKKTGLPRPVHTTYHIGHGQQLARQRADARHVELAARHAGQDDAITRQQLRRETLDVRKQQAAAAERQERADALAAFRANPGVISSRKVTADRAARRKAANAAKANTSPFKHLHRAARERAILAAAAEAEHAAEAPAKPKRTRTKKAAA